MRLGKAFGTMMSEKNYLWVKVLYPQIVLLRHHGAKRLAQAHVVLPRNLLRDIHPVGNALSLRFIVIDLLLVHFHFLWPSQIRVFQQHSAHHDGTQKLTSSTSKERISAIQSIQSTHQQRPDNQS